MGQVITPPPHDSDVVVYRGEFALPDIDSIMSRSKAIYFGTQYTANAYAELLEFQKAARGETTARVYPCRIIINRPFVNQPDNQFLELSEMADRFGVDRAVGIAMKFGHFIVETCQWRERINPDGRYCSIRDYLSCNKENVRNLYFDAYHYFKDEMEVYWHIAMGYDGAIHRGNGHGSAHLPEYCVFNKSQIRSIFV